MKPAFARVLLTFVLALFAAPAYADLAPADHAPSGESACRGKRPDDLCALSDGGGGVCTVAACDARSTERCLLCAKGPVNTPGSQFPAGFLIVGAVLTITCAVLVVLKLRRHWGDKA